MARVVTFEGIEGAGKTLVSHLTARDLVHEGFSVFLSQEPYGIVGEFIRSHILSGQPDRVDSFIQLFLFEAQRADHIRFLRDSSAQTADFIILDRYVDSTTAYQGYGLQLNHEMVEALNRLTAAEFWPEKTFLFDIDPYHAASRVGGRKQRNAWDCGSIRFQQAVRQGFLQIASQYPERVRVIDARKDVDALRQEILRELL